MIYELRSYEFDPAGAPPYLALFQSEGLEFITRHLPLLGYWLTETGGLNRLHHLWVYRDLEDRAACRASAAGDAEWTRGFAPKAFPMIRRQVSCLMTLETGSEALEAAVAAARTAHAARPADAPVTGPDWAMLSVLPPQAPPLDVTAGQVAAWRVLSGLGATPPGARVLLHTHGAPAEVTFPAPPVTACELMRPTCFSPL